MPEFDQKRRVYIDDNGKDIPASQLREWIDDYIDSEQEELDSKTAQLRAGEITVAEFFAWLAEALIAMHGAAAVIAYGGEKEMNADRWAAVGGKLAAELEYLKNFEAEAQRAEKSSEAIARAVAQTVADDPAVAPGLEDLVREQVAAAIIANSVSDIDSAIEDAVRSAVADSIGGAEALRVAESASGSLAGDPAIEDLIWGAVGSRGRAYMEAVYGTYENAVKDREEDAGAVGVRRVTQGDDRVSSECEDAATDEFVGLDEIPDIGTLDCMCVTTPHSRVLTARGWIPISEVEAGDFAWTHRGRWQRVIAKIIKISQPYHRFVTVGGVGFTDNHRLLTPRGWEPISVIVREGLSVYNWSHEKYGMSLRKWQGLSGARMPFLRNESQGQDSVAESARGDVGRITSFWKTTAVAIKRHYMEIKLAAETGRWTFLYLVLGREREASQHLSLSVGMGEALRSDSSRMFNSSQESRSNVRPTIKFGVDESTRSRKSSWQGTFRRLTESHLPDLPDSVPRSQAWPLTTPKVLRRKVRQTPVLLWDLEVSGDHSFIIEGLVSHNSNCRCYFEFSYLGIEPLQIEGFGQQGV